REHGYAQTPRILTPQECRDLVSLYGDAARFRSRIDMARVPLRGGGLPVLRGPPAAAGPGAAPPRLAPLTAIADRWQEALGARERYPQPRAGQRKPAPLLLHYEAGGYSCLHRDLYGEVAFPFQLAAFLSRAGGATTPGAGSSWWSSARGWSRAGV